MVSSPIKLEVTIIFINGIMRIRKRIIRKFLGLKIDEIKLKISNLKSVEHRLQIVSKTPKFIIDDGFNGNFEGMSASYDLVREYDGNKDNAK